MILDDASWLAIRTTPGVTGFVGTTKDPLPLSEKEVATILKFISTPAKRFKTRFSLSEAVKITDGPFSGFLGSISEMDEERGKVKVLVSIFGRETPVELDFLQIQKFNRNGDKNRLKSRAQRMAGMAKKLVEKKGGEPWPGTQDSGQPRKTGEVPPEREDLTSGKSGGVSEPDQDLGV